MKTLWVVALGLVALMSTQGCKRKEPEPIPGPKAESALAPLVQPPGIAWFQGSFDEAFAATELPQHCQGKHGLVAPRSGELARNRKHITAPAPTAICSEDPCPKVAHPRHRLV